MSLPHGIPSHDTFGRVFAALNARQFEACFMRWMSPLLPALSGQVVAIDGKTVRGSHRNGERAIHLVSAFGSGLGAILGQVRAADKSNEITAMPELLDALLLKGAIVTIDAMGCQQATPDRSSRMVPTTCWRSRKISRACWRRSVPVLKRSSACLLMIAQSAPTSFEKSRRIMAGSKRVAA
ncbi:putative transposase YbfD/YdcC [Burkholderia ambifaria]|nr:putative transposase YbfD/YdcC [Burkholderia ambifaria]